MELKWSKECSTCARRYPTSCGVARCLQCKDELERTQKPPTVTEAEWNDLSYVYGRKIPGSLSTEEQAAFDREWAEMEAEADRRGAMWTIADLLEEGFGSVRLGS